MKAMMKRMVGGLDSFVVFMTFLAVMMILVVVCGSRFS